LHESGEVDAEPSMSMSFRPHKPILAGFFETRSKVEEYQVSVGSHLCSAKRWEMASCVAALSPQTRSLPPLDYRGAKTFSVRRTALP
jgi:hypothetical protein